MNPGDEADSPVTDDPTAPALAPPGPPTAEAVLRWIVAAEGPWFPSEHARQTGTPRDALDDPLSELRRAGLVRVGTWVRGTGQGYVATPEGEAAAAGTAAAAGAADLPRAAVVDVRPPVVTPALLLANLLWFFVGLVVAVRVGAPLGAYLSGGNQEVLSRLGAVAAADLLRGEWWRLVANCFVHIGVWHLVLNLAGLGVVGSLAELLWGRWRLLVIYALSGLGGSCLAMAHRPLSEAGVPVVLAGASGAIWGVSTSLAAWLLLFRRYLPRDLVADWTRRLGFAFALNVGVSFIPGVSWEAHAGGRGRDAKEVDRAANGGGRGGEAADPADRLWSELGTR